ncbi:MAG: hypothetical protein ACKOAD_08795, partial [Gammaproteobacteria bacterium]
FIICLIRGVKIPPEPVKGWPALSLDMASLWKSLKLNDEFNSGSDIIVAYVMILPLIIRKRRNYGTAIHK